MEQLSNRIANKIALELNLDKDKRDVISYGLFGLIHTCISILLVILLGVIFNILVESLIVAFTSAILRKFSGGVHASSPGSCSVIGAIVAVCMAMVSSIFIRYMNNFYLITFMGILVFVLAYYLIFKLAPVDSAKKPIKREEKREKMRKRSIQVLIIYIIIVLVLIIINIVTYTSNLLKYSLCIYGGVIWQVFTLTKSGYLAVGKVDSFLNYSLGLFRR